MQVAQYPEKSAALSEENLPHFLLSMAFVRQSKLRPPVHHKPVMSSVAYNVHQDPSRKVTCQPSDNSVAGHVAVYQPFDPTGVSPCVS